VMGRVGRAPMRSRSARPVGAREAPPAGRRIPTRTPGQHRNGSGRRGRTLRPHHHRTETPDRARDQVFLRVRSTCSAQRPRRGIQAVQRTRHLFSEHCSGENDTCVIYYTRVGRLWRRFFGIARLRIGVSAPYTNGPKENLLVMPPIGINAPFRRRGTFVDVRVRERDLLWPDEATPTTEQRPTGRWSSCGDQNGPDRTNLAVTVVHTVHTGRLQSSF
jgi:hypothetical protein